MVGFESVNFFREGFWFRVGWKTAIYLWRIRFIQPFGLVEFSDFYSTFHICSKKIRLFITQLGSYQQLKGIQCAKRSCTKGACKAT